MDPHKSEFGKSEFVGRFAVPSDEIFLLTKTPTA